MTKKLQIMTWLTLLTFQDQTLYLLLSLVLIELNDGTEIFSVMGKKSSNLCNRLKSHHIDDDKKVKQILLEFILSFFFKVKHL